MNFSKNLLKKIEKWEKFCSLNHHKQRDSQITVDFLYDWGELSYRVQIYPYMSGNLLDETYNSWEEVEDGISKFYDKMIAELLNFCGTVLDAPEIYDEAQIEMAKGFFDIFEKELWLIGIDYLKNGEDVIEREQKIKFIKGLISEGEWRMGQLLYNQNGEILEKKFGKAGTRVLFYVRLDK